MKACPTCGAQYHDSAVYCARDRTPLTPRDSVWPLVGQVLDDRYRIIQHLATGGMGEVYLGEHVHMGRRAAIKVISEDHARNPTAVDRFRREAQSASRISHPNVCAIYDYGITLDGLPYIAMEFVAGETLASILKVQTRLPVARALEIVRQCAAGLQAAHALDIVHRDLKPENILLQTSEGGDRIKLVDFGIAKAIGEEDSPAVTRRGVMVGTPQYMAPEQVAGDPVDGRTDLYALALVCYRMIAGSLPFPASTTQEAMTRRLTDPPAPLGQSAIGVPVPAELEQVLNRALARLPNDRFPSVETFAESIGAIPLTESEAVTVQLERPASPPSGRRRSVYAAAAAAAVVTAVVGIWSQSASGPTGNPPSDPIPSAGSTTNNGQRIDSELPVTMSQLPPSPVPSRGSTTTVSRPGDLTLPDIDSILSADPSVRLRASQQNQHILDDLTLGSALRASAALGLAQTARLEERFFDEIRYLEQAYRLNPLPRYLTELNNARKRRGTTPQ